LESAQNRELTSEEQEKIIEIKKERAKLIAEYEAKYDYYYDPFGSDNETDSESENELQSETLAENSQQVQTKSEETINISESLELILKEYSNQQISVSSNQNLSEILEKINKSLEEENEEK